MAKKHDFRLPHYGLFGYCNDCPVLANGARSAVPVRVPSKLQFRRASTPDNPEAGNQYPTDVGRIAILAVHKTQPRFLVIELKRNQSTDQTIGQTLRYVGWVKKHLAQNGQSVEALIIAHQIEKEARYAISTLPTVKMMRYEVEFRLDEC